MATKLRSNQVDLSAYATTSQVTSQVRERLTAPRTYYVSSSWGNDSATGLDWNSAFYSIQKAINVVTGGGLDFGGQTVTIQLAQYQGYSGFAITSPWTGGGSLVIQGDTTTPANCIVTGTSYAAYVACALPSPLTMQGLELRSSGHGIQHDGVGLVKYGAMRFGAVGNFHVYSNNVGAAAQQISKCWVVGNAQSHWCANVISLLNPSYSALEFSAGVTISFAFAYVTRNSVLQCSNITFTGSFTGPRFLIDGGGVIYSGSASQATYFPGSSAGTVGTNGQWL